VAQVVAADRSFSVVDEVSRALEREGPEFDPLLLTLTLTFLRAGAAFERAHLRELSPYGLTTGQFNVLTVLDRNEGPLTMGELGQAVSVRPANLTGVVDSLVAKGYVMREPNPVDRRSSNVSVTREGRQFLGPFLEDHWRYLQRLFAGVGMVDRHELERLLELFLASVQSVLATHDDGGTAPTRG
jgi:DNA-binding MarR family transcriptional regulator